MRWPWWGPASGQPKAKKAIQDAAESLERVKAREPEVRAISQVLKNIREQNHFAEQLQSIISGGR